uniref:DUF4773 domain-containing protein n=1 Tax=Anopheles farauti TaxID=69004 RepID=A0A182QA49_9DIPT
MVSINSHLRVFTRSVCNGRRNGRQFHSRSAQTAGLSCSCWVSFSFDVPPDRHLPRPCASVCCNFTFIRSGGLRMSADCVLSVVVGCLVPVLLIGTFDPVSGALVRSESSAVPIGLPQHWEPSSAVELRSVLRSLARAKELEEPEGKQLPTFSATPLGGANPCKCLSGVCSCCLGVFSMNGCANLTYIPEDFAFEFRMIFNNRVLTKNRISGKNPKPICVHPPRFDFIEVCANFYDVYFVGRNMHVCMEMNGNFEGYELFSRSFNCLRIGDKGVKVMKPGELIGGNVNPSLEAEIDSGDDIEDYDEAVVLKYTTKVKCELDSATEKDITENGLKPRKHRGRIKCSNTAIPPEIHDAIVRCVKDYPLKSLVNDGQRLNNCIRSRKWYPIDTPSNKGLHKSMEQIPTSARRQPSSMFEMHDEYSCLKQLVGRSDAEYAVLKRIFTEINQRDPDLRPRSFLDFGAGIGTGTWAVADYWREHLFEILSVDKSRHMNDLAELVLRHGDPNKPTSVKNVFYRQFLPASPERKYDIVLSAFSLFDQSSRRRLNELVDQLYNTFDKYLIFVEQGSNAGFQLLDGIRNHIRRYHASDDSHLFAPCPHNMSCPRVIKEDGTPCNFEATYKRNFPTPEGHQHGTILYSYLVYRKNPPDSARGFPRLVRPTAVRSKHCVCHVCSADGKLRDVTFTTAKHGQVVHRCAKASRWGDLLPMHIQWEDAESPSKTEEESLL